mmetsp:Transcript_15981/g.26124  ORF Transcript_15981/g.26124 Transcript_15981/m.26124 type:complete len:308 (+) Transcript_15981:161-1084(+)
MCAQKSKNEPKATDDGKSKRKISINANWQALIEAGKIKKKKTTRRMVRPVPSNTKGEEAPKEQFSHVIDWSKRYCKRALPSNKVVALDCEMVGVGPTNESRLARVCIVNEKGEVLFESYSKPKEKVTDYRTKWSGIRAKDIADAPSLWKIHPKIEACIRGKILVGHSIKGDLEVLQLNHPQSLIRDTAMYIPLRKRTPGSTGRGRSHKLKTLTELELGQVIQEGEHDPYIDARASLEIYKKHAKQWEQSILDKRKKRLEDRVKQRSGAKRARLSTSSTAEEEPKPSTTEDVPKGDIFASRRTKKHKR